MPAARAHLQRPQHSILPLPSHMNTLCVLFSAHLQHPQHFGFELLGVLPPLATLAAPAGAAGAALCFRHLLVPAPLPLIRRTCTQAAGAWTWPLPKTDLMKEGRMQGMNAGWNAVLRYSNRSPHARPTCTAASSYPRRRLPPLARPWPCGSAPPPGPAPPPSAAAKAAAQSPKHVRRREGWPASHAKA